MGGSGDTVLAAGSERESGVCISFRHRKNLTDCCNPADEMREYFAAFIFILFPSVLFLLLMFGFVDITLLLL